MLVEDHDPSDGRIDFEAGMSYFPAITLALMVLNCALFAWQVSVGALDNEHTIVAFGALSRDKVLDGELWRLVSPMVLHGSVAHVIGNCTALYILGIGMEHAVGGARTAGVYLLGGIAASIASVVMHAEPSVGASGAVFAIMGALIVFLLRHRDVYEVRDKRVAVVLAAWAGYALLTGMAVPYIDNAAHLGGLAGGAALGLTLSVRPAPAARPTASPRRGYPARGR
jgi:rhomboid protease GluP